MKSNIIATLVLLTSLSPFIMAQNTNEEYQRIDFSDKFAFKTAIEMYEVAETKPYGEEAEILIKRITDKINQGLAIEHESIWDNLEKLEPYRKHPEIQDAVRTWVDRCAQKISGQKTGGTVTLSMLQAASKAYNAREFAKSVQECKSILKNMPNHCDIRSNMALALLHLNKDLCAQIELEITLKVCDSHIPAMLNLTVVYERLDMRNDAEEMVAVLTLLSNKKHIDIPLARFNAAWFQFQDGNSHYADTLLNSPKGRSIRSNTK